MPNHRGLPCHKQDAELARPSKAAQYTGWEESLEVLLAALKTHAPVDGLLGAGLCAEHCTDAYSRSCCVHRTMFLLENAGFSQGATATALLLSELATRPDVTEQPRFAIMVRSW